MIGIQEFNSNSLLDLETVRKINNLVYDSDIKERFDFGEILYIGIKDNEIVAIEVFKIEKFDDGSYLPRLIHIIFHQSVKRSKDEIAFLIRNEKNIKAKGFNRIWAYINYDKKHMIELAKGFGFQETEKDDKGVTLIKRIGV